MTDDFEFEMEVPRQRIPDARLLQSLVAFSKKRKGTYFGVTEYDAWPDRAASSPTILKRFGSWNDALKKAGLRNLGQQRNYDPAELIAILKECWKELKKRPTVKQFKDFAKRRGITLSEGPYRTRWGTLKKTCQRICDHQQGRITEEQLYAPTGSKHRLAIPKRLRWEILERDKFTCVKCGRTQKDGKKLTVEVDHILPDSKGGSLDKANLQTLCFDCNRGKANREERGQLRTPSRRSASAGPKSTTSRPS